MWGRALTVIAMVGCSNGDAPPPTLSKQPEPAGPAAPPPRTLPPAAPGELRLTQLDIDLALPPDASMHAQTGGASVWWKGCTVEISAVPATGEPRTHHRIGTLELDCIALPWRGNAVDPETPPNRDCLAVCDHMHAVPGGTAEDSYPTDPPVLEYGQSGGFAPSERSARVWRDGTVQYSGSKCPAWRGARGQLPRDHVATLMRELEAGGFFAYTHDPRKWPSCTDAVTETITARSGDREHTINYTTCSRPQLARLGSQVANALGKNPCAVY